MSFIQWVLIHLDYPLSNMLSKQENIPKKQQKKMLSDLKINWINWVCHLIGIEKLKQAIVVIIVGLSGFF